MSVFLTNAIQLLFEIGRSLLEETFLNNSLIAKATTHEKTYFRPERLLARLQIGLSDVDLFVNRGDFMCFRVQTCLQEKRINEFSALNDLQRT